MDIYFLDRRTTPDVLSITTFDWEKSRPAVEKVETLPAKVVGAGKNKILRIGWNLEDVMRAGTSAQKVMDNAVQREIARENASVARLKPHYDYMERLMTNNSPSNSVRRRPSIVGSHQMEFTGPGWQDEMYNPDNMWMDIQESELTDNVYEAMFDFGPALKGMMLISTEEHVAARKVHSRILDTMDAAEPAEWGDQRSAFLQGFMFAMKRERLSDKEEAVFAAYRSPSGRDRDREDPADPTPTKYFAKIRGSHRVPEWEDDFNNVYSDETAGRLKFKDGELCEFDLVIPWKQFDGVPSLLSVGGTAKGYKVSQWSRHEWEVPVLGGSSDIFEGMLEKARDGIKPGRKRKRADWNGRGKEPYMLR